MFLRTNSTSKLSIFQIKMAELDDNSSSFSTSLPEKLYEITGTPFVNSFTTESVTKKRIKRSKVSKTSSCSAIDHAKSSTTPISMLTGRFYFVAFVRKLLTIRGRLVQIFQNLLACSFLVNDFIETIGKDIFN